MKQTTPEREAIYSFFLEYLNMKPEQVASTFEISESSLRRKSSGWLEKCHRITKKIIEIEPETTEDESNSKQQKQGDVLQGIPD